MSRGLALVTGASSGLGRAIAVELARRGRDVVLLARDVPRLEAARDAVRAAGGTAHLVASDVRDEAAVGTGVASAVGDAPLALLVHAAGILRLGPLEKLAASDVRDMLDVNVVGAVAVVRATLPRLSAARGRVVVVSSIAGRMELPDGFTGYGASKWAVRAWAEIARPELARRGIGLTVAYPSILDTPMLSGQHGPDAPAVYRAFPWHDPVAAARRIVDDAERGRRESFLTLGDRVAAWAAGAMPRLFHAGLGAVVRLRGRGAEASR